MAKGQKKPSDYAIMVEPLLKEDGGGWLASVPALPGCMGDGETEAEALSAIEEWKDAADRVGNQAA